ncbi:uncharacterized protein LOC102368993 isoform X2 [Alligator sinensis]|uniref:Uncharacterized protein LOC102368993 isoform X2 n=1 Tax=Alligator sinensis TaxID=38654 RepID=A0A3Q0FR86_ALLSI|nr:uncharacterized protein LOC102368993 isoform X2 [Alligator sinensis]
MFFVRIIQPRNEQVDSYNWHSHNRGEIEAPPTKHPNSGGMEMRQMMAEVVNIVRSKPDRHEIKAQFDHLPEELQCVTGSASQCFITVSREKCHEKEEEYRKLKEENKALQEKFQSVLAKTVRSHRSSEDLNDPSRESAVLERDHMLQTQEWAKAKYATSSSFFPLRNTNSGTIIQMVFSKCEENIKNKLARISSFLQCPALTEASGATSSKQTSELVREIRNHLRNLYFNYSEAIYRQWGEAALPDDMEKSEAVVKFAAECYRVYSLLFLQNPPITAVWPKEPVSPLYIQHVDLKKLEGTKSRKFLWPILFSEGNMIKNGVVYD